MARTTAARSIPRRTATASRGSVAKPRAISARKTQKPGVTAMGSSKSKASKVTRKRPEPARLRNDTITPRPSTRMADVDLEAIWVTYKKTKDQNIRNILIEHHMPLVRMIAERVLQTLPKSIELDDLSSAGTFGLMDAIDGFDLSRGIKFKTYCTTRIRGSILDELRSQDWVPRLVRLKAHRLEKALRKLDAALGITASAGADTALKPNEL